MAMVLEVEALWDTKMENYFFNVIMIKILLYCLLMQILERSYGNENAPLVLVGHLPLYGTIAKELI